MEYKFANKKNYEDFSAGRVIHHKSGMTNFPVRITEEVIWRCISYIDKDEELCIYDPCCGTGYLLTVAGFLFRSKFKMIVGSDIDVNVLKVAEKNLSLLSIEGLNVRKKEIAGMLEEYNKDSHYDALNSISFFEEIIKNQKANPIVKLFRNDILNENDLSKSDFISDIVIVDIPYGELVDWKSINSSKSNIELLLDSVVKVINYDSIVVISSKKNERIITDKFTRIERLNIGKRKIELLKLKENTNE